LKRYDEQWASNPPSTRRVFHSDKADVGCEVSRNFNMEKICTIHESELRAEERGGDERGEGGRGEMRGEERRGAGEEEGTSSMGTALAAENWGGVLPRANANLSNGNIDISL